jgi:hypothetical protein
MARTSYVPQPRLARAEPQLISHARMQAGGLQELKLASNRRVGTNGFCNYNTTSSEGTSLREL